MDKKISYISSEFGICQNEFPKGIQNLHSSIYLRVFTIVICSDTCKQKQPKVPPLTSASSRRLLTLEARGTSKHLYCVIQNGKTVFFYSVLCTVYYVLSTQ